MDEQLCNVINNSPIFHSSFHLVIRRASSCLFFFKRVCFLVLLCEGLLYLYETNTEKFHVNPVCGNKLNCN